MARDRGKATTDIASEGWETYEDGGFLMARRGDDRAMFVDVTGTWHNLRDMRPAALKNPGDDLCAETLMTARCDLPRGHGGHHQGQVPWEDSVLRGGRLSWLVFPEPDLIIAGYHHALHVGYTPPEGTGWTRD